MEQPSLVTCKSRHDAANLLSKWTFFWMTPLFRLGSSKDLDLSDLEECCRDDEPTYVTSLLDREWQGEIQREKIGKDASLTRAIFRAFGWHYMAVSLVIIFGELVLRMILPFLVGFVIRYLVQEPGLNGQEISRNEAIGYAAGIAITCFLYCLTKHRACFLTVRIGNNIRTALTVVLFRKLIKLSSTSMNQTDIGQVINIMTNDLTRIEDLSFFAGFVVVSPIMCVIVIYFTSTYLNWAACIAGFGMICSFVALQALMGVLFGRFRQVTTDITDERVNRMSELISAMKIVKFYCWEDSFAKAVDDIRRHEISTMQKTYYLKVINLSFFFIATRIMVFVAFIVFVLMGNSLDSERVFVVMALYDAIRLPVTVFFPTAVGLGAETLVAFHRIQKILLLDERVRTKPMIHDQTKGSISLKNFSAKWTRDSQMENLSDLSLQIDPGDLVVVIGSVGSGKTCFLHALLDEIEKTGGLCSVSGTVSYAPQESWCFGGDVKQNILLSNADDGVKLKRVIKVCGLEKDLQLFPNAENTFVGEKGYSLSGGQKARISLARAIYHDSDVYLLDDPLSAVDPKVANHIFTNCIAGYLRNRKKTVVLVTHQLQFLRKADKILVLNEGKMIAFGSYSDLLSAKFDFLSHLESDAVKKTVVKREVSNSMSRTSSFKAVSFSESCVTDSLSDFPDEESPVRTSDDREEQRASGKFDSRIYGKYFMASGKYFLLLVGFVFTFMAEALYRFNDLWLSAWTQKDVVNRTDALGSAFVVQGDTNNVIIYSALMAILFVFAFLRTFLTFLVCLASSVNIHDSVFKSLLRAPIAFYESNPLGRILNRCTRDIGVIDQVIPATVVDLGACCLSILGVVVISLIVNQWLIIPCIVLGYSVLRVRNFYIMTGRDLQRLDSVARSPVYNHVGTTFTGLASVRAFCVEEKFEQQFNRFMRDSAACRFLVLGSQRAVAFWMDSFSNIYVLCITIVIMAVSRETIAGGDAGLLLTSSLMIMNTFQYCIRLTCDFETQMISCERVMEYGNILPEAPLSIPDKKPDPQWPKLGVIEIQNLFLWYTKSMPPVLRDINLRIEAGEKVGVVGRTGAGKSSLISCLFRLTEPVGKILIDDEDILVLGLHDVRSRISIIPQDPVLFSGTVRQNMDPFSTYPDEDIWEALLESNLRATVTAMEGKLDAHVTEGGSNLSVGQRQLLCLARALLRRNKILVCDEATANVDHETDELIRKTIRTKFNHCTVLTVAHRLNTIIDADKVIVMDAGRVVEFDEPHTLLSNPDGLFSSMVRETGVDHANNLHKQAHETHLLRLKTSSSPKIDGGDNTRL